MAARRVFLIIDGYNLMHAAGLARRRYGPGDLERCRRQLLLRLVQHLSPEAAGNCTVVFDAFDAPSGASTENRSADDSRFGKIQILFAAAGNDADSEIETLLNSHSAPRQVLVVSADHRLHKSARRRRARCVDSEDFWAELTTEGASNHSSDSGKRRSSQNHRSSKHQETKTSLPAAGASAEEMLQQAAAEITDLSHEDHLSEFLKIDVRQLASEVHHEPLHEPARNKRNRRRNNP